MGKKPATIAAFECGPSGLKFVEMPRNERRVLSARVFPLEPGRWRDRDHLAAQVRTALDAAAQGRVETVIASVPIAHASLRVVEAPGGNGDVREYLAWEMARYLGRPAEDYAFDFQPMEDIPAEGARRYLAAAFRRDEAVALRAALETGAGRPLAALDVDAAAVVNAFAAAHPDLLSVRAVLIHANAPAAALIRTRQGEFHGAILRREGGDAPGAAIDPQDRAEGLLRRARGIAAGLADLGPEWAHPDQVFLCGDLAADADFQELLRAHLPHPFRLLNPYGGFPGPDVVEHPGAHPGAPFAAAVGLALRLAEGS